MVDEHVFGCQAGRLPSLTRSPGLLGPVPTALDQVRAQARRTFVARSTSSGATITFHHPVWPSPAGTPTYGGENAPERVVSTEPHLIWCERSCSQADSACMKSVVEKIGCASISCPQERHRRAY